MAAELEVLKEYQVLWGLCLLGIFPKTSEIFKSPILSTRKEPPWVLRG
jgi:hypothetical protein